MIYIYIHICEHPPTPADLASARPVPTCPPLRPNSPSVLSRQTATDDERYDARVYGTIAHRRAEVHWSSSYVCIYVRKALRCV